MRPYTTYASMFNDPTVKFPGPGTYNGHTASENKNGFTVYSKYKSPGGAVISRSGRRFDSKELRNSVNLPGPG